VLAPAGEPACATDRIVLEADSVAGPQGFAGTRVVAQLDLPDTSHAGLQLSAARLALANSTHAWLRDGVRDLRLGCAALDVSGPDFACQQLTFSFAGTPLGPQSLQGKVAFQSAAGRVSVTLAPLQVAGGTLRLQVDGTLQRWSANVQSSELQLVKLQKFLQPWFALPAGWQADGLAQVSLQASGAAAQLQSAVGQFRIANLAVENADGSIATDKLALTAEAKLTFGAPATPAEIDVNAAGASGQALLGPVLVDFSAAPLAARASGTWNGTQLVLQQVAYVQVGLISVDGSAVVAPGAMPTIVSADLVLHQLDFPSAYASLMQLSLAGTDFGALQSSGSASGRLSVRNDAAVSADLALASLSFADVAKKLGLEGLNGDLHWRAGAAGAVPSTLSWSSLSAYGLQGGGTTLGLVAYGDHIALERAARIPVFDGALAIQRLEANGIGSGDTQIEFAANIEPIGMPLLSRAFGWPEMQGSLAGAIPGLAYRKHVLSVAGDITANVFGGTVVANRLVLQDPLGAWPKLDANFTARNLDLEQITRTFPIGTITGHLDADITGLELFNWSPVAFDAHLFSTPGDKAKHRISQRAVTSISDIGGGGGVGAALQSGFLKFFKEFGYSAIGLRCQLRDDICLMSGIARPDGSFYIVQGGGLPRVDIVGNAGRVGWSQLVSQINAALAGGNIVVQ
jgi:hypothetical protein